MPQFRAIVHFPSINVIVQAWAASRRHAFDNAVFGRHDLIIPKAEMTDACFAIDHITSLPPRDSIEVHVGDVAVLIERDNFRTS